MFLKHSFQGTGINQVLKESKVPKGSFYHFFPSKEDFALAVLENQVEHIKRYGQKYLEEFNAPYLDRFTAFFENLMKPIAQSDFCVGCLVGSFGQEMAALSPPLRQATSGGFVVLKEMIRDFIEKGQAAGEIKGSLNPEVGAVYIVSAMQGSIIMAKVEKSSEPLDIFIKTSVGMLMA